MKTDALIFRLLERQPDTFFLAIGLPGETAQHYDFKALEYKETSMRVDGVFLPKEAGLPIYFVEVQFYRKPEVYADVMVKVSHYLKHYNPAQEYRGVVLFATRTLEPKELRPYQPLLDAGYLLRIYLDELPTLPNASLGMRILQLIRQSDDEASASARRLIVQAKAEIGDEAARHDLVELIETVLLYKLPRLTREEIQAMLQVDDIRETRVWQEAKEEGREEGREEGAMHKVVEFIAKLRAKNWSAEEISEFTEAKLDFVQHEIRKLQAPGQ